MAGSYARDARRMRTIGRSLLALGALLLVVTLGACATAPAKRSGRGVRLTAVATCTLMACPGNSCCNSCTFSGWTDVERGLAAVAGPQAPALPTCDVDGCGRCAFSLEAEGAPGPDGSFVVSLWRKR
jgi:hypothetical protein